LSFRRGFKTEANQIATEIRSELGLSQIAPLNPWALSEHLAIDVLPLSGMLDEAPSVAHFLGAGCDTFSAITIFAGTARLIIHNDRHSKGRQSSNIAHELSHALLQHPPMPPLSDLGLRNFNKDLEDEANWLAGVLLIPERAALNIASQGLDHAVAARQYGVSPKMVQYRLNVTGAYKRVQQRTRSINLPPN
jgi:Zn-dependent peptidase ImmA (M78 family)